MLSKRKAMGPCERSRAQVCCSQKAGREHSENQRCVCTPRGPSGWNQAGQGVNFPSMGWRCCVPALPDNTKLLGAVKSRYVRGWRQLCTQSVGTPDGQTPSDPAIRMPLALNNCPPLKL
ncbi:hypothetical protein MG293_020097 [Ovis ammon polii]|uniref:Uncharacterized protein n=1 Tax=Ovis ammon polii TaxID=230172 RepID=A0AAD4TNF2_OVIAM|nr:hypothetical protein MG293_020097 [Ovis ammon polii]